MSSGSINTHSWQRFKSGSEIRGNAESLTDVFAERIGYVFAHWLAERLSTTPDKLKIAVGRDSRNSGPRLKSALIQGITAADSDVFDCDLCTPPAMFMTTVAPETRAHGAIMVTGSHYSSDKNGFKFILREGHMTEADVAVLIDRAAKQLKIDPLEIRRRNVLKQGDVGAIGQTMDHTIGLLEALDCFEQSDFYKKAKADTSGEYGYGFAAGFLSAGFGKGVNDQATITIVQKDDGYEVRCGLVDIGQGSETALTMIAAEALEVEPEKITMIMADTELTQDCSSTAASRSCYIAGNAILDAVKLIKKGEKVAVGHAVFPENELDSFGVHTIYGFIVQGAKIKIDPVSGAVNVLEVHNVTEAGTILNPVSVKGQMFGGIVQSTGYAISEQMRYRNGNALEDSFASYVIPTAMDAPHMTSENIEAYEPTGPYGVKGVAEAPTVAIAAAIANAVTDLVPEAHIHTLPIDRVEILRNYPKKNKAGK